jgi:hypothetical protein
METFSEFSIEVEGVGYACGYDAPPFVGSIVDDPSRADVITDEDRAFTIYGKVTGDYRRLGQPEMAERVRIRARTVTVTREPWRAPQTIGASTC